MTPESTQERSVLLENIVIDPEVQPRTSLDESVIERYEELYRTKDTVFPKLLLHEVGGDLYLCDGFTRHAGATRAGIKAHDCVIRLASTRGALMVDAVRQNAIHGQPLTASDRRKSAIRLIKAFDASEAPWSQEEVAKIVGVSQSTIHRIVRDEFENKVEDRIPEYEDEPDFVEQAANRMLNDGEDEVKQDKPVASRKHAEIQSLIDHAQIYPDAIHQLCRKITEHLRMCTHTPGCENVVQNMTVLTQAKETLLTIREMRPEMVCPNCDGHGCGPCHERGWLTHNASKRIR